MTQRNKDNGTDSNILNGDFMTDNTKPVCR